jgi:hypothetical protein
VSTCRAENAGKEKLAGKREKAVGMDLLKAPVAGERGWIWLSEKLGTRGMVMATMIPTLQSTLLITNDGRYGIGIHDAKTEQDVDEDFARKPGPTQTSLVSDPLFELLSSSFGFLFFPSCLCHISQLGALPFRS